MSRKTTDVLRWLQRRGLGVTWTPESVTQADLVLCLLGLEERRALDYVTELTGRPIFVCPPQHVPTPAPVVSRPRHGDDRLVLYARSPALHRVVAQMDSGGALLPRSPLISLTGRRRVIVETPMYDRMAVIRRGLSVSQLVSRGVTRRDLLIAERRGWLEMEREPTT